MRMAWLVAGASIVGLAMATQALASSPAGVPEIDGGSIAGGLALLAGGIVLARSRWRAR